MTEKAHSVEPGKTQTYIVFVVAGTSYAVPSQQVQHMEMVEQVTPVPNAPAFIEGVVFSRGQVVPVINLRARFGFERTSITQRARLLVVQHGSRSVGLLCLVPRSSNRATTRRCGSRSTLMSRWRNHINTPGSRCSSRRCALVQRYPHAPSRSTTGPNASPAGVR